MTKNHIYIGENKISHDSKEVEGELVNIDNENYYKIV